MTIRIGVQLPINAGRTGRLPDIGAVARHAEQAGLDAVWAGDHLVTGRPTLEATVALATAAGATNLVVVPFGGNAYGDIDIIAEARAQL